MATISRRRLAETTVRLLRNQPERRTTILRSLAAYLVVHKRTQQLDLFIKDIARELQRSEGTLLAEVRSAFPLDQSSRNAIIHYLQQQTTSRAVELREAVDQNLLSGVIVRTADQELNTSARHRLQQLASLTSGGKN